MYIIKVNGMTVKLCRSFNEAKRAAIKRNGKIFVLSKASLPKATMVRYNDSQKVKNEIFREVYSENNHGYHLIERR